MKLKFNFKSKSVDKLTSGSNFKIITSSISFAVIVWVIITILETILISGGLYSKGAPFIIFEMIAIIVAIYFYSKKMKLGQKELVISVISMIVTYAILDFLLVNLLLQKNDLSIYKFWAYYLKFALVLAMPFIRSRTPKIQMPNLKMPLTKKS